MRKFALPLGVVGALLAGLTGLAAPAHAETVKTTPMQTLSSGLCVGEVQVNVSTGTEQGVLGLSVPPVSSVFGIAGLSGACSFDLITRWHNLDTGATGEWRLTETVGSPGCDVFLCSARQAQTGSGRVAVEVTSNRPITVGTAEVVVP